MSNYDNGTQGTRRPTSSKGVRHNRKTFATARHNQQPSRAQGRKWRTWCGLQREEDFGRFRFRPAGRVTRDRIRSPRQATRPCGQCPFQLEHALSARQLDRIGSCSTIRNYCSRECSSLGCAASRSAASNNNPDTKETQA